MKNHNTFSFVIYCRDCQYQFFPNNFVYFRYNKSYYFLVGTSRNILYKILYRNYSFHRKSTIAERFTCYKRKFYKHSHDFSKCQKLLCQYLHDYILFVCLLNVQYCMIKIMHCKRPSSKNILSAYCFCYCGFYVQYAYCKPCASLS